MGTLMNTNKILTLMLAYGICTYQPCSAMQPDRPYTVETASGELTDNLHKLTGAQIHFALKALRGTDLYDYFVNLVEENSAAMNRLTEYERVPINATNPFSAPVPAPATTTHMQPAAASGLTGLTLAKFKPSHLTTDDLAFMKNCYHQSAQDVASKLLDLGPTALNQAKGILVNLHRQRLLKETWIDEVLQEIEQMSTFSDDDGLRFDLMRLLPTHPDADEEENQENSFEIFYHLSMHPGSIAEALCELTIDTQITRACDIIIAEYKARLSAVPATINPSWIEDLITELERAPENHSAVMAAEQIKQKKSQIKIVNEAMLAGMPIHEAYNFLRDLRNSNPTFHEQLQKTVSPAFKERLRNYFITELIKVINVVYHLDDDSDVNAAIAAVDCSLDDKDRKIGTKFVGILGSRKHPKTASDVLQFAQCASKEKKDYLADTIFQVLATAEIYQQLNSEYQDLIKQRKAKIIQDFTTSCYHDMTLVAFAQQVATMRKQSGIAYNEVLETPPIQIKHLVESYKQALTAWQEILQSHVSRSIQLLQQLHRTQPEAFALILTWLESTPIEDREVLQALENCIMQLTCKESRDTRKKQQQFFDEEYSQPCAAAAASSTGPAVTDDELLEEFMAVIGDKKVTASAIDTMLRTIEARENPDLTEAAMAILESAEDTFTMYQRFLHQQTMTQQLKAQRPVYDGDDDDVEDASAQPPRTHGFVFDQKKQQTPQKNASTLVEVFERLELEEKATRRPTRQQPQKHFGGKKGKSTGQQPRCGR